MILLVLTIKCNLTDVFVNYYIDNENANMSFSVQFINPDVNLINATSNGKDKIMAFNGWTLAFRTVF